jgi:hypothetical protein
VAATRRANANFIRVWANFNEVFGEGIPSRLKPVLEEKWLNQVQEQPPGPLKLRKKLKSMRPGE